MTISPSQRVSESLSAFREFLEFLLSQAVVPWQEGALTELPLEELGSETPIRGVLLICNNYYEPSPGKDQFYPDSPYG